MPAKLTCLCGLVAESLSLLASRTFPIESELCHCTDCRYSSGALAGTFVQLGSAPSQPSIDNLTEYQTSSKVSRYFCKQCGCHCFIHSIDDGHWSACSGIVDFAPEDEGDKPDDVVKVTGHYFVPGTLDGGIAPRLLKLGCNPTRNIPAYSETPATSPAMSDSDLPKLQSSRNLPPNKSGPPATTLSAICHCGEVSLTISRPSWPDAKWPNPGDPNKYLGCFCTCRSCRLSTGISSLQPWTYVAPSHITDTHTSTTLVVNHRSKTTNFESLGDYRSSDDVTRSFCKKCGATVLYAYEGRPQVVDLSVGLLRAEEGAIARRWIDWEWNRISHKDEAVDRELANALSG